MAVVPRFFFLFIPPLDLSHPVHFLALCRFVRAAYRLGEKSREMGMREERRIAWLSRYLPTVHRARLKRTQALPVWILEMFARRAVQILIKRNIFRMRALAGTGEARSRVPFFIFRHRGRKSFYDKRDTISVFTDLFLFH